MSKLKKDGTPDLRANNVGSPNSGRPSKAKQMRLLERLEETYHETAIALFKGQVKAEDIVKMEGADAVISQMWEIALDVNHANQFAALKWITDRYFGKEPKAILSEELAHDGEAITNIQKLLRDTIDYDGINAKPRPTEDKSDFPSDTEQQ